MVERFDDDKNRHNPQRALQVYQILIGLARNRQTVTYSQLASMIGYGGSGVLGQMLGHVMGWCRDERLPPLTALIVGSRGVPGDGLVTSENREADREDVYNTDWYGLMPPTIEQLHAAVKR